MKILLIDNHSKHIEELESILLGNVDIISREELGATETSGYDLIIFSGGSSVPSVLNHPDIYQKEIDLVRTTSCPVIGICLGCEIITSAFGGTLKKLDSAHRGEVTLTITDSILQSFLNTNTITVHESHNVGIAMPPENFIVCAVSEHGPEIIKHKTKPIIGIQFHPEIGQSSKKSLFQALLKIMS